MDNRNQHTSTIRSSMREGISRQSALPLAAPGAPVASGDDSRRAALSGPVAPPLRVNLLGGFEILVEGVPYAHPALHRQKVKSLLAVMVLSEGREVGIEHLERLLWPRGSAEKNRNNFNNLWSLLRRALAPESDEDCPYLARYQGVCKVVRGLVDSDVAELHRICDAFLFLDPDFDQAVELYRRLQRIYRGDLLPGEVENPVVLRERDRWRDRTVDALQAMALSLKEQGSLHEALRFTQAALTLDPGREDIVRVEMRLALDLGNPARAFAALAGLKHALREQFGLDPSPETLELAREARGDGPALPRAVAAAPAERAAAIRSRRPRHPRTGHAGATLRTADGSLPARTAR